MREKLIPHKWHPNCTTSNVSDIRKRKQEGSGKEIKNRNENKYNAQNICHLHKDSAFMLKRFWVFSLAFLFSQSRHLSQLALGAAWRMSFISAAACFVLSSFYISLRHISHSLSYMHPNVMLLVLARKTKRRKYHKTSIKCFLTSFVFAKWLQYPDFFHHHHLKKPLPLLRLHSFCWMKEIIAIYHD